MKPASTTPPDMTNVVYGSDKKLNIFLVSKDEIKPSRLGYVGFSWGGSLRSELRGSRAAGRLIRSTSAIPRLSADMTALAEERRRRRCSKATRRR